MPDWRFHKYDPARDSLTNPISSEFFSSEAIKDSADALVRESIQNSLDARDGEGPVTVRFTVESQPEPKAYGPFAASLMGGLAPHTLATGNGLSMPLDARQPAPFLVVEDFNTTGLAGNPDPHIPEDNATNNFFAFFRAEGWTNKGEEAMGRWGIGKTVFPRSSRLNAFFGWTIRKADGRSIAMGRCILRGHKVDGTFYLPHGQFGDLRADGVFGVEDAAFHESLRGAFRLTRRTEPGLTVIVPHIDPEEITGKLLTAAVVRNYFHPILTGSLVVQVSDDGNVTAIDKASLPELSAALSGEQLEVMHLVRESLGFAEAQRVKVPAPLGDGAPKWDNVELAESQLVVLREQYLSGRILAFEVHLPVRRKDSKPCPSSFEVLVKRSQQQVSGRPVCVREGIVIADARAPKVPGVISVIHAAHGDLATLLGDSENVAHTIWAKDTKGFKERYTYAAAYLDFVKQAPSALVRMIAAGDEEEDAQLLDRFFGIDVEEDVDLPPSPSGGKAGATKTKPGVPPIVRRKPRYVLSKVSGGFSVSHTEDGELPGRLVIRVAHDVRRGKPLQKYHPADFDVSTAPITLERVEGGEVIYRKGNELHFEVREKPFNLTVTGFDKRRDLFVDVDPIDAEESGT